METDRMGNGLLIIDKPAGWTSHDVVAKLRRILGMKRVGHTGTLDPEATGVLPVAFGKATRLADLIGEGTKVYEAVLKLGTVTDTQDMTGRIISESSDLPDAERIAAAASGFLGDQVQIPPMYSARKINGKKLYELARAGQVVPREPRPIRIDELRITDISLPYVSFTVTCSKGTYVRTICHDMGQRLGCGGAMQSLRRTRAGAFGIERSCTLEQAEQAVQAGCLETIALSMDTILADYPRRMCLPGQDALLKNGNALKPGDLQETDGSETMVRMCTSDGAFLGLYRWDEDRGRFVPYKMFVP